VTTESDIDVSPAAERKWGYSRPDNSVWFDLGNVATSVDKIRDAEQNLEVWYGPDDGNRSSANINAAWVTTRRMQTRICKSWTGGNPGGVSGEDYDL
jgi:hypothetical protein